MRPDRGRRGGLGPRGRQPPPRPAGHPVLDDAHYPPRENKGSDRTLKATSTGEAAFLQLGPGAASWLVEARAAGVRRIKAKMAEAVALSRLYSVAEVDRALGTAAKVTGRFALRPGTSARSPFGLPTQPASDVSEYDECDLG